MWDTAKAMPKGKLIALNVYTGKEEKPHIGGLRSLPPHKNLEKEELNKSKVRRRTEMILMKS